MFDGHFLDGPRLPPVDTFPNPSLALTLTQPNPNPNRQGNIRPGFVRIPLQLGSPLNQAQVSRFRTCVNYRLGYSPTPNPNYNHRVRITVRVGIRIRIVRFRGYLQLASREYISSASRKSEVTSASPHNK